VTDQDRSDRLEQALFEIRRVIAGQDAMLERVLVCLLAQGHLLIEGVPGLAKTLTIKTAASVLGGSFETELGPVFCNFLLADEINRAPAKVQSALLEVMQERQAPIGGDSHRVPLPFLVMATQNPIESEGTYSLPEAQLDRFMLKVLVSYPETADELTVIQRALDGPAPIEQILSIEELVELQAAVRRVYVDPALSRYALRLAAATRDLAAAGFDEQAPFVEYGVSPRGPINLVLAARALALLRGRRYVVADDLRALAKDVFRHRLVLSYEALAEGISADDVLEVVLAATSSPEHDHLRDEVVA